MKLRHPQPYLLALLENETPSTINRHLRIGIKLYRQPAFTPEISYFRDGPQENGSNAKKYKRQIETKYAKMARGQSHRLQKARAPFQNKYQAWRKSAINDRGVASRIIIGGKEPRASSQPAACPVGDSLAFNNNSAWHINHRLRNGKNDARTAPKAPPSTASSKRSKAIAVSSAKYRRAYSQRGRLPPLNNYSAFGRLAHAINQYRISSARASKAGGGSVIHSSS